MKGEQYLTKPEDFARVHGQGRWLGGRLVGLKSCSSGLATARYGFIVSKRVGQAVVRNRVKRRLREIMRGLCLQPGRDIVLSARPPAALAAFAELKTAVVSCLLQAGLLIEK